MNQPDSSYLYELPDEPDDREHYDGCDGDPRWCRCDEEDRWADRLREDGL